MAKYLGHSLSMRTAGGALKKGDYCDRRDRGRFESFSHDGLIDLPEVSNYSVQDIPKALAATESRLRAWKKKRLKKAKMASKFVRGSKKG